MIYITNSFSLNMLPAWRLDDHLSMTDIQIVPVDDPIKTIMLHELDHGPAVSCVGHADTAAIYSSELFRDIPMNRVSVQITESDVVIIGQYSGPRMPEGSTVLPNGAKIRWIKLTIN